MAFFRNLSMFLALFFTRVFIFIIPKNNANRKSWIAWAVNPTSAGMVGSQAFVAFQKSDGTMTAYTSPVTSYGTTLEERSLNFEVYGVSASFEDGTMILYASFKLPGNSKCWIDWIYLNLVCPGSRNIEWNRVGNYDANRAMMGRYLKAFEATGSTWFHLHRACQILAYIIGTAASLSASSCQTHLCRLYHLSVLYMPPLESLCSSRSCIRVLAAIFLGRQTSQARTFWNIFHYVIGYGVIVLSIINMFRGFSISNTGRSWRNAYFCVIVSLGCVALTLEVITWFLACKRRNKKTMEEISAEDNITPQEII
ncbi:hypothetical protein K1719_013380 [Acacia pycnantha]|nr:hypothetical protein K1719_013380 [Acacia pycnantha]